MAIHVSNIANLVLFVAKVFASIESRSLAVIASTLDSSWTFFRVHTVVYLECYEKSESVPLSNWQEENAAGGSPEIDLYAFRKYEIDIVQRCLLNYICTCSSASVYIFIAKIFHLSLSLVFSVIVYYF